MGWMEAIVGADQFKTVNIPHFLHKIPPQFTPQTEYLTKKYLEKYLTC